MDISYSVSLCSLIFSYPYTNNALNPHNQRGFYGPRQVLHFAPLKQCALIILMWVLHFAPLKQCALIIIMWVLCEHDPKSISRMSCYAPRMSQALKDHIWAQLSLGYTTKQIYDKHKAI